MVHKLRVIADVEPHVNTAYYHQHPALISGDEKRQSVMVGKLYSSYRTVSELAQGPRDSKTSDLNCSYETDACPETSIDRMS